MQSVITMDDKVLDMEIVRSLRQQAPTPEDMTALKEFDGDHSKLGKVSIQEYLQFSIGGV